MTQMFIDFYSMKLDRLARQRIGIIDCDIIDRGTRFPNIALGKISQYHKLLGDYVELITSNIQQKVREFSTIYMGKVFTDTRDIEVDHPNLIKGGSGFFWNNGPRLPEFIEHSRPDYHLYDGFITQETARGIKERRFRDYKDYSVGFITRGCFRKCKFCINANCDRVEKHSDISEFMDPAKRYIALWDDNFLGYSDWERELNALLQTGKPFTFRQGLDLRLMTEKKAKLLSKAKYIGNMTFAWDKYEEGRLILEKLDLWRQYYSKKTIPRFFLITGFFSQDAKDVVILFERIRILMLNNCLPFVMKHRDYEKSPYRGIYVNVARWCNIPSAFKKLSFREFCEYDKSLAQYRYMAEFEKLFPDIARKYFDLKFTELRGMYRVGDFQEDN